VTLRNVFCGVCLLAALASGQARLPASSIELGANLLPRPIAGGDLLSISVYGASELSRTVRVSEEGLIRLPMLKAPMEAPATTMAWGEASAWMAGTTSCAMAWWYWLNSHMRYSVDPSFCAIALPAALSHEYTLIRPASIIGARNPTRWWRSTSSASPPAVGNSRTGTP